AAAVSAYVALAAAVALGMLRPIARQTHERLSWIADEGHQYLSILAVILMGAHLITLVFDPYLPFSWLNLILPHNEPFSPFAVDLGVLAFYGMAIVSLSSWIKRILPYSFWRGLHGFSFIAFVLVTVHGCLAGSDTQEPFMYGIYTGCSGAILFLGIMRLF